MRRRERARACHGGTGPRRCTVHGSDNGGGAAEDDPGNPLHLGTSLLYLVHMPKTLLEVPMRRGVAASLNTYDLYSPGFADCSPVVMFNNTTRSCGLFHFYAGKMEEQSQLLKDMANEVSPTVIY